MTKKSISETMEIRLSSPGMTALHKAGLAGLWMTLQALDRGYVHDGNELRKSGLQWEYLDNVGVRISWADSSIFMKLFEKAFRINNDGLFWFPALGNPQDNIEHSVMLQEALLGTILQHGGVRISDLSQAPQGNMTNEANGDHYHYRRVQWYTHQGREYHKGKKPKKPTEYSPVNMSEISGTLYPGGVQRHIKHKATKLKEPRDRALALRFLLIGATFLKIQQRRKKGTIHPSYAMVIPQIENLSEYSEVRRDFGKPNICRIVSGATEAAYRIIAIAHIKRFTSIKECRVFAFGTVPWNKQQKTKVQVFSVRTNTESSIRIWRYAEQCFPIQKKRKPDNETPQGNNFFWLVPQMPELIANNLANGRAWWYGFSQFCMDGDRRNHILGTRRGKMFPGEKYFVDGQNHKNGGIASMVENDEIFPESRERTFVSACHEAWRYKLAQDMENASKRGVKFDYYRAFEKQRIAFSRCKNASSIREVVADFWARAGKSLPTLHDKWDEILPLFDGDNWRLARDLALLSLASYKPQKRSEEKLSNPNKNIEGDEHE